MTCQMAPRYCRNRRVSEPVNSPRVSEGDTTYIRLNILILQVKSLKGCIRLEPIERQKNTHMFPHIDADDRVVSYIIRLVI